MWFWFLTWKGFEPVIIQLEANVLTANLSIVTRNIEASVNIWNHKCWEHSQQMCFNPRDLWRRRRKLYAKVIKTERKHYKNTYNNREKVKNQLTTAIMTWDYSQKENWLSFPKALEGNANAALVMIMLICQLTMQRTICEYKG